MNAQANTKSTGLKISLTVLLTLLVALLAIFNLNNDVSQDDISVNGAELSNLQHAQNIEISTVKPIESKKLNSSSPNQNQIDNLNEPRESKVGSTLTRPINRLSALDDESLLALSDVLENSLIPAYLDSDQGVDSEIEQNTAIDIFVSRLPEGLSEEDFQQVNSLLRDHLPYDMADELTQRIKETYLLELQEQAYIDSELPNNTMPKSMSEQIAIAKQIELIKGNSIQQKTETANEASQAPAKDSGQDTYETIADKYGLQAADDYQEMSELEEQWQDKYAEFLVEKNIIIQSGLSAEDKTEQIESLIKQHYDESEWAVVRAYTYEESRIN